MAVADSTKRILITGGTDGIGQATAMKFVKEGHLVTISGRNEDKASAIIQGALKNFNSKIEFMKVDFNDLNETERFAEKVVDKKFDIIVLNAGVMAPPISTTQHGVDTTMQVNVIAPYLIAESVLKNRKPGDSSQHVVFLTSFASIFYGFRPSLFCNYGRTDTWRNMGELEKVSGVRKYALSKFANAVLATYVTNSGVEGITATAVHPGTVITNLVDKLPRRKQMYLKIFWFFLDDLDTVSRHVVNASFEPLPVHKYYFSGEKFFANRKVLKHETTKALKQYLDQIVAQSQKKVGKTTS